LNECLETILNKAQVTQDGNFHFNTSFFFTELKICHLSFLIIAQDAFDIANPSSMQDARHNELRKI